IVSLHADAPLLMDGFLWNCEDLTVASLGLRTEVGGDAKEFANCVETLTPLVAVLTLWPWVPVDLHESIGRTDGLVLALLRTWSSDAPHQARAECLWRRPYSPCSRAAWDTGM